MNDNDEFQRLKLLLIAVVAFAISGWFSWVELKYKVWGAEAEATVDAATPVERRGRRGRRIPKLDVSFHYTDESTQRSTSHRFDVSQDSNISHGDQFLVQYLPGVENSARQGGSIFPILFFGGSILFMGWSLFSMAREANQPLVIKRRS